MTIKWDGEVDERPGYLPWDLIFILEEKSHPLFRRERDDLHYSRNITLRDALLGVKLSIPRLSEKMPVLQVGVERIEPGFKEMIKGAGMPSRKYPGSFGDLYVNFNILFPKTLSTQNKKDIQRVFEKVTFQNGDQGVTQATYYSVWDYRRYRKIWSWIRGMLPFLLVMGFTVYFWMTQLVPTTPSVGRRN